MAEFASILQLILLGATWGMVLSIPLTEAHRLTEGFLVILWESMTLLFSRMRERSFAHSLSVRIVFLFLLLRSLDDFYRNSLPGGWPAH